MKTELRELWDRGVRVLDIYWLQDNRLGDERWWCDVINDHLCEMTGYHWIWTVTCKKWCVEEDDADETKVLEGCVLVKDMPYSDMVVRNAIVRWLHDQKLMFDVRVIDPSGTIGEKRMLDLLNED